MESCRALGISEEGISVTVRPMVRPADPSMPTRISTIVAFPSRIGPEQREAILAAIDKCTVKKLLLNGINVSFELKAADAG